VFHICPLSPDHYRDIQRLYRRCFGMRRSLGYIREKYATAIGFVAYDGKIPAASYVVFRQELQGYSAAQSGDTMTDPRYRNKGLFTTLAKRTFKKAKEEGIDFVFGFPNDNSLHGFEKLGGQFTGNLKRLDLKVNTIPLAEICHKLNIPYRFTFNNWMGKASVNNHLLVADWRACCTEKEMIQDIRHAAFWLGCRRAVIVCSENTEIYQSLKGRDWRDGQKIGYFLLNKEVDFSTIRITWDLIDTWR
jgi:GNAT superfamily N-acetyltransferase